MVMFTHVSMSLLQGLSEPLGALMALAFVGPDTGQAVVHYLLAFVGGIMVSANPPLSVLVS
jgi:zinc transporter ZupT